MREAVREAKVTRTLFLTVVEHMDYGDLEDQLVALMEQSGVPPVR